MTQPRFTNSLPAVLLLGMAAFLLAYLSFGHGLIQSMYDGTARPLLLNQLIRNRDLFPLDHYVRIADTVCLVTLPVWGAWFVYACLLKRHLGRAPVQVVGELLAIAAFISLLCKCVIDVDRSYDSWCYHLPFAARIWGIVPQQYYGFEYDHEAYYRGLPLLGETLHGMLWRVTGHLQAANLVSFGSLALYAIFLRWLFSVPLHQSFLGLLAVPLIQIHSSSCYVDLLGNLSLSALILLTYAVWVNKLRPDWHMAVLAGVTALAAGNTRHQLLPAIVVALGLMAAAFITRGWRPADAQLAGRGSWLRGLAVVGSAGLAASLTALKNSVVYGNPFYPIRINLFGFALNGVDFPDNITCFSFSTGSYRPGEQVLRWLRSVFEVGMKPFNWSIDQGVDSAMNCMGGYFGLYVLANLVLLAFLVARRGWRASRIELIAFVAVTGVAILLPKSFDLRYYIFWFVVVISLNLLLLAQPAEARLPARTVQRIGALYPLCFLAVAFLTHGRDMLPHGCTLGEQLNLVTDAQIVSELREGDDVQIVGAQPWTFAYASRFHGRGPYHVQARRPGEQTTAGRILIVSQSWK